MYVCTYMLPQCYLHAIRVKYSFIFVHTFAADSGSENIKCAIYSLILQMSICDFVTTRAQCLTLVYGGLQLCCVGVGVHL